jgi:hypothetical protein
MDESGTFSLADSAPSLVVSLICPDSFYGELCDFVRRLEERLGVTEAKGNLLSIGERLRVCHFMKLNRQNLVATAFLVRPNHVSLAQLKRFRDIQASRFLHNKQAYLANGGRAPAILAHFDKLEKIAQLSSRLSDEEFLQSLMMVENVRATLQHSIVYYMDRRWNQDFASYQFIIDRKLPGKLSPMEKYIKTNLLPFLDGASKTGESEPLVVPDTWKQGHCFTETYLTPEGDIDLDTVFGHGLQFLDSATEPGLRVVDMISNTLYAFFAGPDDPDIERCYALLRHALACRNPNGRLKFITEVSLSSIGRDVPCL